LPCLEAAGGFAAFEPPEGKTLDYAKGASGRSRWKAGERPRFSRSLPQILEAKTPLIFLIERMFGADSV
jgi:hypothetical protein